MMHFCGIVLFLLCLACGAALANGLAVSADAREAFTPTVLRTAVSRHAGPKMGASSRESKYRAAPLFRFGPRARMPTMTAKLGSFPACSGSDLNFPDAGKVLVWWYPKADTPG